MTNVVLTLDKLDAMWLRADISTHIENCEDRIEANHSEESTNLSKLNLTYWKRMLESVDNMVYDSNK